MLINCLNKCHIKDFEGSEMVSRSTYLRATDVWLCSVQKILPAQTLIPAFTVGFQSGSARNYYHIPKGPEWVSTCDHWPGTVREEKVGRGDERGQIHPDSFEVIYNISCSFFFFSPHIKAASSHPLSVVSSPPSLLSMLIGLGCNVFALNHHLDCI